MAGYKDTKVIIIYGRYPKYLEEKGEEHSHELQRLVKVHKESKFALVHKPEIQILTDRNYLNVNKDANNLKQLLRELKKLPRSFLLILPARIIYWYRGSITNLVMILHELNKVAISDDSLQVTSEQIYEYLRDWKKEQALQTDYLLKYQGRTVGRPVKDVAIEKILDMACSGESVAKIAAHFQVSRMLIWRRIKRTFEETDLYLRNKGRLAESKLRENDRLKDRRVLMGENRRKARLLKGR